VHYVLTVSLFSSLRQAYNGSVNVSSFLLANGAAVNSLDSVCRFAALSPLVIILRSRE
jgi:hypothetical protein